MYKRQEYHVALGYLPTSTWLNVHPEWYATEGNEATAGNVLRDDYNNVAQICYNAHDDEASYELMLTEMFDVLKRSILANQDVYKRQSETRFSNR